jgi:ADP-heptose:LPS heptosyltransferase
MVSNDTGPAHLAAAVGVPVIVIMDRLTPHVFTPIGEHHRLIFGESVTKIGVQTVYEAAQTVLAQSRTDQLIRS